MKTNVLRLVALVPFLLCPLFAQDQTVTGNLTVTGTIGAGGIVDSAANELIFGTQGGLNAVSLLYTDDAMPGGTTDTLRFTLKRISASWLWAHATDVTNPTGKAMRLDSAHQLILYKADGATAGVTLTPATNPVLSLGTATLTASGTALTAGGAFSAAGNFTVSNGNLTGSSSVGLNLVAGGSTKNITLTPGATSGVVVLNGKVGINTSTVSTSLDILKATGEAMQVKTADSNAARLAMGTDGSVWYLKASNSGTGSFRPLTFQTSDIERLRIDTAGNVGIGTTTPAAKLEVSPGAANAQTMKIQGSSTVGQSYGLLINAGSNAGDTSLNVGPFDGSRNDFVIRGNGNVGIGTTIPGLTLDVNGPIRSSSGSIDVRLQAGAAGAAGVGSFSNDPLLLITAGTEKARITTAGNVGIGTTSPGSPLQVRGSGNANLGTIRLDSINAFTSITSRQYDTAGEPEGFTSLNNSYDSANNFLDLGGGLNEFNAATRLSFYTAPNVTTRTGVARMVIDQVGNVGVGTPAPGSRLDVVGDGSTPVVINARSRQANSYLNLVAGPNDQAKGEIAFERTGTGNDEGNLYVGGNATGNIVFRSGGYGYKMLIAPNGNVGIGTASPGTKLQVADVAQPWAELYWTGSPSAGNKGALRFTHNRVVDNTREDLAYIQAVAENNQSNGGLRFVTRANSDVETMRLTSAGNVGIGTTSPAWTLDVKGSSAVAARLTGTNGSQLRFAEPVAGEVFAIGSDISGGAAAAGSASFEIYDLAHSASRFLVNPAGNVGIGTTSPTHKLAVKGTIRAEEIIVDTGWADYVFADDYRLAPLAEVESHIKAKKHLPGIPSAAEVAAHGVSMGDMQAKLLSKVEELTLHLIAQEKELATLRSEVAQLKASSKP